MKSWRSLKKSLGANDGHLPGLICQVERSRDMSNYLPESSVAQENPFTFILFLGRGRVCLASYECGSDDGFAPVRCLADFAASLWRKNQSVASFATRSRAPGSSKR